VLGAVLLSQPVDDAFAGKVSNLIGWDLAICTPREILASSLDQSQRAVLRADLMDAVFYDKERQVDIRPDDHLTIYYELVKLVDEPFSLVLLADGNRTARMLAAKQNEAVRTAMVILLAGLGVSVLFSFWLVRPLRLLRRRFCAAARELAGAELAADHPNEITALVRSFGQMETALRAYRQERTEVEIALQEAKEEADQASRAKSEFLSTMSHEIRTPMTAILGFTELMKDPALGDEDRQDYIRIIRNNGNHLLSIINDILDLSKVEAGQMELEQSRFSPLAVAEEVISLLGVQAAEKGIELRLTPAFPLPEHIVSDSVRVKQMLVNLVGNALKFTDDGSVTVGLSLVEVARPDLIRFTVTDTGMGMTPEQQEHLFQAFCQGDASISRRFGGTGLGLTISRSLARMLGGEITVASEPGRGTRMEVTIATGLPADAALLDSWDDRRTENTPELEPLDLRQLKGLRILLAEDNKFNQRLAKLVLQEAGLAVTGVENGRQAVAAVAAASAEGQPFVLVLMDMMMPEMDGLQATRELRRSGYDLPIIALTANAMDEDRQRCLAAGCDGFTTKPFRKVELLQAILDQMHRVSSPV
jgi:signal transduction histidine kinase/ActR/RegA family two-component response regulator